jgi:hypothetical protein
MINKENFELLQSYLGIFDKSAVVDVIFLFGGITMPEVWHKALELYQDGFSEKVYIAGGVGKKSKADKIEVSEAETIKTFLLSRGVPSEAVIIETKSTNTLENILCAKKVLESAKKVIAVSKPFHMRRVLATFNKQYPQLSVLCCPPELMYENLDDQEKEYYFDRMLGEVNRLSEYAQKGDIVSQKIPSNITVLTRSPA